MKNSGERTNRLHECGLTQQTCKSRNDRRLRRRTAPPQRRELTHCASNAQSRYQLFSECLAVFVVVDTEWVQLREFYNKTYPRFYSSAVFYLPRKGKRWRHICQYRISLNQSSPDLLERPLRKSWKKGEPPKRSNLGMRCPHYCFQLHLRTLLHSGTTGTAWFDHFLTWFHILFMFRCFSPK